MGRTIAERVNTLPAQEAERVIDFLQKAYVEKE
jgi:hypothetical protein